MLLGDTTPPLQALAQIGQGVAALVLNQLTAGVAQPGSVEAWVGLMAVGMAIVQQLM